MPLEFALEETMKKYLLITLFIFFGCYESETAKLSKFAKPYEVL